GELVHQPVRRERERFDIRDRRGQVEPALVARRRDEWRPRIGGKPPCTIEGGDKSGADASCESRAWQRASLPERSDTGGRENRDNIRREVEMDEGQRRKRVG